MDVIMQENEVLKQKINLLEDELNKTKEHLKKYTAPNRSKTYYENHKEEIKEKMKKTDNSEKKKEYNRISYLRKKEKVLLIQN